MCDVMDRLMTTKTQKMSNTGATAITRASVELLLFWSISAWKPLILHSIHALLLVNSTELKHKHLLNFVRELWQWIADVFFFSYYAIFPLCKQSPVCIRTLDIPLRLAPAHLSSSSTDGVRQGTTATSMMTSTKRCHRECESWCWSSARSKKYYR